MIKIESLFKKKSLPLLQSRVELLISYKKRRSTLFSLPEWELEKLVLGKLIMEMLYLILGSSQITPSGKLIELPNAAASVEASDDSL